MSDVLQSPIRIDREKRFSFGSETGLSGVMQLGADELRVVLSHQQMAVKRFVISHSLELLRQAAESSDGR